MIPAPFDYHRPGTLDEAIGLLARYGDQAKVLAGGMSLLPTLKLRLGSFGTWSTSAASPALEYVKEEKGVAAHRRGHAAGDAGEIRSHQSKYPRSCRRDAADRRPAGAQPRHDRRQYRQRRPGERPAGDRHRARRRAGGERARAASAPSRRAASTRVCSSPTSRPTRSSPRSASRLPPAQSGGAYRKLKRKTGDYAVAAVAVQLAPAMRTARWSAPASRSPTWGRRRSRRWRREVPRRARPWTKKPLRKRRSSPRRRLAERRPARLGRNTSERWRACWRGVP